MKKVVIAIINYEDGEGLKAFDAVCKRWNVEYTLLSPPHHTILDISVSYTSAEEIFMLGCAFQHEREIFKP